MNQRPLKKIILSALGGVALLAAAETKADNAPATPRPGTKPNIILILAILAITSTSQAEEKPTDKASTSAKANADKTADQTDGKRGRHLFILSGQSNMHHMDTGVSFTPAVEKAFGKDNVTVVKNAKTGAPIRAWDKDYKWPEGRPIPQGRKRPGREAKVELEVGALYDQLMAAVKKHAEGKTYDTVTFVWMQGESDAGGKLADLYVDSFKRVVARLKSDLKINSINIVIGRLSDYGINNPEWVKMREIQMKLAEDDPNCEWVNTDDLNDKKKDAGTVENALHYTEGGYKILGQRFAEKAIGLIEKKKTVKE